jgi:hypothetical protein
MPQTRSTGTGAKVKPVQKPARVRLKVGADVGPNRYEENEVVLITVFPPATARAWLDQGLLELVEEGED